MKKILGYTLSAVGIAIIALSYDYVRTYLQITLPIAINEWVLTIIGLAIAVVGIIFLLGTGKGKTKQAPEVPIYQGNNIVGYRRHGK